MSSFGVKILTPLPPVNRHRESQSDGLEFSGTWEPDMSFNPDSAVMLSCSVIKLHSLSFLSNDDMYNNVYQKRL